MDKITFYIEGIPGFLADWYRNYTPEDQRITVRKWKEKIKAILQEHFGDDWPQDLPAPLDIHFEFEFLDESVACVGLASVPILHAFQELGVLGTLNRGRLRTLTHTYVIRPDVDPDLLVTFVTIYYSEKESVK